MNDDDLKNLFSGVDENEPSPSAKTRAIQTSMAEYRRMQRTQTVGSQTTDVGLSAADESNISRFLKGLLNWLRPTVESTTEARSHTMNQTAEPVNRFSFNSHKWQIAGVSTVSVMLLAVMLANPRYNQTEPMPSSDREVTYLASKAPPEPLRKRLYDGGDLQPRLADSLELSNGSLEMRDSESLGYEIDELRAAPHADLELKSETRSNLLADRLLLREVSPTSQYRDEGRDRFSQFEQQAVKSTATDPISTFSVDVDTASYSFVRRQLNQGRLPKATAVRVEEMVNYFDYDYPVPSSKDEPFSTSVSVIDSPWREGNKLVHIGLKGYELPEADIPNSNLVFLLDVSGSMQNYGKLPLVKQSMELLLTQLKPDDTVSIVVYAGAAGLVLEPTKVSDKATILSAVQRLTAGGSTAGGEGLRLAYQLAELNFREDAVNRVILATDGDFNVGMTDQNDLQSFIERKRDAGIYLSVLGFGQGNLNDSLMQSLAQNGNGIAAHIDTLNEAQKVLVDEATSTLFPIANDVKIQVEFNPATVSEYRLIGYETRKLANEDFNNDKVDAGEIGAGHTVTAIYEITTVGSDSGLHPSSRYGSSGLEAPSAKNNEYGFVKLRYKLPGESTSQLISEPILVSEDEGSTVSKPRPETAFATAVAGFGQLLNGGKYTGSWSYEDALDLAQANKGDDPFGYRTEFVQLIRKAMLAEKL